MQGGTELVRHIWNELKSYDTSVSAFWLQIQQGKQLIKDLSDQHINVMTYCKPCLAPVYNFLNYANDEHVHNITYQQFLIGAEILVVPVLDKGIKNVKAYFPIGNSCWQHIWTGKQFNKEGFATIVEAQIGYPAVFVKTDSIVGDTFLENLRDLKIL